MHGYQHTGYGALSRQRTVTQELGQGMQYAYAGRGRREEVINARGNRLFHRYEPWGPLKQVDHYRSTSGPSSDRTVAYAY